MKFKIDEISCHPDIERSEMEGSIPVKINLPEEELERLRKRNRIKKLSPKVHKIAHESGRSTKSLWAKIVERSKR